MIGNGFNRIADFFTELLRQQTVQPAVQTNSTPQPAATQHSNATTPHATPAAVLMAQGREEKKIPVMKMSGLGVSIKRPHIEEEQRNPSSNPTAAHQAAQPEEDYIFNERDLNYYWQEYAGRMPKEQVAIAKRMQNMRITLINDTTFEAVVDNEIVAKEFTGMMLHAMRTHACNLGCLIAHELAAMLPGCPSFIADPGVVDELDDVARITGSPLMPSITIWHALNQRAIARRYAAERSALQPEAPVHYEDLNLIVCHLGGGVSVGVHRHGRAVDVPNALDGFGPFSPERAGTLPAGQLIDLCHSGRYTTEELKKRISGKAGLAAHLGTTDIPAIERRIAEGDTHAALVLDAMIYRIAKEIGGAAVVLYGKVDAILLTGGMAHSEYITSRLQERVSFLAPVHVYPGEDELEALVMNALGALRGELPVQVYR